MNVAFLLPVLLLVVNWASEVSPTLRCSIEISRGIMLVCLSYAKVTV